MQKKMNWRILLINLEINSSKSKSRINNFNKRLSRLIISKIKFKDYHFNWSKLKMLLWISKTRFLFSKMMSKTINNKIRDLARKIKSSKINFKPKYRSSSNKIKHWIRKIKTLKINSKVSYRLSNHKINL